MPYGLIQRLKYFIGCFLVSAFLMLTGCSSFFSPKEIPEFPLLTPAGFSIDDLHDVNIQITQRVTTISDQSSQTLLAAWVVNKNKVNFVGLSPTGQRLLTLSYDGIVFNEEYSHLLEEELPGRAIMSYMQLAHWPEESIKKELKESKWKMKVLPRKRSLYYKGRHVMDILLEYNDVQTMSVFRSPYTKKIQIISSVMALQLNIETLDIELGTTH